jgi:peptidoglycan hydrolase CwlO-like protein
MKLKTLVTLLGIAALLVGWGITWANQNGKIVANSTSIESLTSQVKNVASQATESDKAIIRMETKIEYIIKGIDEIKAEVKGNYIYK